MVKKRKVWFVDDLPENLERFQSNHEGHFDIEVFSNTGEVLRRINNKDYPDALLCDVFFYDSVEEARDVELKYDNHNGIHIVVPVDRIAVTPEVIV
jgi:hypothetical protein